jgi:hypothetical protein
VPQLSAESLSTLDDIPMRDDAAAQARAYNGGHRGSRIVCAEQYEMAPQGSRVPVIEISNGLPEPLRQAFPNVKSCPSRMYEVRRSPRTKLARRTRRPGRVKTNHSDIRKLNACLSRDQRKAVFYLLETNVGPLACSGRTLAKLFNEKLLPSVQQRVVNRSTAKIHSRH